MWFLQFMFGLISLSFLGFDFCVLLTWFLYVLLVLIQCFWLDFSVSVFFWVLNFVLLGLWFLSFILLFHTQYYPTTLTCSTEDSICRFWFEHMVGCGSILCSPEPIGSVTGQPQTQSDPIHRQPYPPWLRKTHFSKSNN